MENKVLAVCSCGISKYISKRCFNSSVLKYGTYTCLKCLIKKRGSANGLAMKRKAIAKNGMLCSDTIGMRCVKCDVFYNIKYGSFRAWQKRHNSVEYVCGSCLNRTQNRSKSKTLEHRLDCSERSKKYWKRPEYRDKLLIHLAEIRSLGPGPSTLERALWKILDDLSIKFVSIRDNISYTRGPWSFDIMIPSNQRTNTNKHLLIEVDGFYRHSRSDVVNYDRSKETFIRRYHQDHELVRILEHEFLSPSILRTKICRLLGLMNIEQKQVNLNNINIEIIDFYDAASFLSAYHYLNHNRKYGLPIGATHNSMGLVGVVLFASLSKDRSTDKADNVRLYDCRELVRFCVSPTINSDNFNLSFLSNTLRILKHTQNTVKAIVAFIDDTSYWALYEAAGFKYIKECHEPYVYINMDGYVIHRRTMYSNALSNRLSEEEMANMSGYTRISGLTRRKYEYIF